MSEKSLPGLVRGGARVRPARVESSMRASATHLRPPLGDRRFWAVQALIAAMVGFYLAAGTGQLAFLAITLLLLPVTYAALNFGFYGAVATAAWSATLIASAMVSGLHGETRPEEVMQLLALVAIAAFAGRRADVERAAKRESEDARTALRAYASNVLHNQEEERRRIAQELHDDPIQSLVLLCRQLDAIRDLDGATSDERTEAIGTARATADDITHHLREIAWGLRPSVLDDLGLVPAIRQLLSACGQRTGIATRFVVDTPMRPHCIESELCLYRIAQEALSNVEHHAGAAHARVELALTEDGAQLTVTDDGSGFDLPAPKSLIDRHALGLLGMQERARLLGGSVTIRSRPGAGTSVHAALECRRCPERAARAAKALAWRG